MAGRIDDDVVADPICDRSSLLRQFAGSHGRGPEPEFLREGQSTARVSLHADHDDLGALGARHLRVQKADRARSFDEDAVAGVAVYLASDAASYTTGEIITIDDGFLSGTFDA